MVIAKLAPRGAGTLAILWTLLACQNSTYLEGTGVAGGSLDLSLPDTKNSSQSQES